MHLYVGWSVTSPLKASGKPTGLIWIVLAVSYSLVPMVFMLRLSFGAQTWYLIMFWIAFIGAGFVLTLFPIMILKDMVMYVAGLLSRTSATQTDLSKRAFLSNSINSAVIGTTTIMTGVGLVLARKTSAIKPVIIHVKGLHKDLDGLRFT